MDKTNEHINQLIQSGIEKALGFEYVKSLFDPRTFKTDNYVHLTHKIKEFAFLLLDSYISYTKETKSSLMELWEIKNMLNYKDLRSVLRWFAQNKVFVLQQGNGQYVNRVEFLIAFHKPLIEHLKRNGKNWKQLFVHYVQGDLENLLQDENTPELVKKYKANSEAEKSFLKKIRTL